MDSLKRIRDLLEYVNTQRVPASLSEIKECLGQRELRVISIKILSWLKSQNRLLKKRPLRLNMQHPWCANLSDWLKQDEVLAKVLAISDNHCDFGDEVSETERKAIIIMVDKEYQPKLMKRA
ncbi:MAG: hypothetical protein DRR16_17830 [Candidatus Parabeggiatoa sp. nov. 3]|nr:MAG: hypothetical protein DRR00_22775 [Gammaproteobacteria bacterium]RKZ61965.1 MAG: hypothetical protein DRQ99_19520 [Gammaproteobacteria bacterium]RKZ83218.1 MAG: hypothetical protein DRR16_17830 [Gammaproteobacteria bacterium]